MDIAVNIVIILCLLLLGGFFAGTETAFTSLSKISARNMLKDGTKTSLYVNKLKNDQDRLIAALLIGTNFVNVLNSALTTAFAIRLVGAGYVSYATGIISILVIVFAEIIPKTYGALHPEKLARFAAVPVVWLMAVIKPVVLLFTLLTKGVNFLERKLFRTKRPLITEEELKTLIAVGETEGTLELDERKMLERLFEFSDISVHEIMRHRSLIKYISVEDTVSDVIRAFDESGYSRLPVYEESEENIIGVLHFKSVLFAEKMITQSRDFVKICMQNVMFVPETMTAVDLLKKFKKDRSNFAVAVNEYGSLAGIVTLDDILKEVFGRISDEHGKVELSPEKRITVVSINEFLVPGDMKLDDFNEAMYLNLQSENYETLGGWLLEKFGELPSLGAVYKHNNVIYIVEDQSSRRIQTVRIKLS